MTWGVEKSNPLAQMNSTELKNRDRSEDVGIGTKGPCKEVGPNGRCDRPLGHSGNHATYERD